MHVILEHTINNFACTVDSEIQIAEDEYMIEGIHKWIRIWMIAVVDFSTVHIWMEKWG
jgi:hypothetical protein